MLPYLRDSSGIEKPTLVVTEQQQQQKANLK
jgi:hypothetical protein